MGPGDVLVLPAFWLHSVRVVEGPAFSVNSWTADYTISPVYADTMQFAWVRGKARRAHPHSCQPPTTIPRCQDLVLARACLRLEGS